MGNGYKSTSPSSREKFLKEGIIHPKIKELIDLNSVLKILSKEISNLEVKHQKTKNEEEIKKKKMEEMKKGNKENREKKLKAKR